MRGYYYLHQNGQLIFKNYLFDPADFDSPFVKKWWRINTENRKDAWNVLLEGLACGADLENVKRLANKWGCNRKDLVEYLAQAKPDDLKKRGVQLFLEKVEGVKPDEWFDWLARQKEEPNWETMP